MYLEKISTSAQKLQTFIFEVLDYARNNRQEPQNEKIYLPDLFAEITQGLQNPEGERSCQIHLNLALENICGDRARLKIILNNLISNAIRFQKLRPDHEPMIGISTSKHDQYVFIEIEDNGEGIAPEVQPRVFEMFYRGNIRSQGSGLGLYIAKSVVSKIQGDISFKSEYGKGSIFTVKIPVGQCDE